MPYKNLSISVLIGGVSYVALLTFLAIYDFTALFDILATRFVAVAFGVIGVYQLVDTQTRQKKYVFLSIILIILCHYLLQLVIHRDLLAALNAGFIQTGILISIICYIVASIKIQTIEAKENPKKISPEQAFEQVKNYRMNPVIRPFGVLMGLILMFFPVLIAFEVVSETSKNFDIGLAEIIVFGLLFLSAPLMGFMFLAYSIPGKTPKFELNRIEKKIKKLTNL